MLKQFLILSITLPKLLFAEAIVVSADRIPSELSTTSNQVFSYDLSALPSEKSNLIWELIQSTPGITISNSGGQGQTTTVFIRGAESRHSLILFEGIELNDASTTGNLADLSQLSLGFVDNLEILPGSQSVLYGSDAIGGVIRTGVIDLEKVKKPHVEYIAELGSHSSYSLGINHAHKFKNTTYFLSANQKLTDGISQTSVGHNKNSEADGHSLNAVTAKILQKITNNNQISLLTQLTTSKTDLDKGFGTIRDDSNYVTNTRNFLIKTEFKSLLFNAFWEPIISLSSITNKRWDIDGIDNLSSSLSTFDSHFTRKKISNQNNFHLTPKDILIFGIEHEVETGQTLSLNSGTLSGLNETTEENQSLFFLHKRTDQVFWSTGFRTQRFNNSTEFTYKIAPGFKLLQGRVWTSVSTGFKNPSLFQQNSSDYGNKSLLAEESTSYEVGLEYGFDNAINVSLVAFHLDIENLIDTTGSFPNITYINLREAKTTGVVLGINSNYAGINISRQNTKDANDFELINRPKLTITNYFKYSYLNFTFNLSSLYKGPKDSGSSFTRTRLPGYTLFNSKIVYDYRKTLSSWISINNITNKEYTDITGFNTDGLNLKSGFSWHY